MVLSKIIFTRSESAAASGFASLITRSWTGRSEPGNARHTLSTVPPTKSQKKTITSFEVV